MLNAPTKQITQGEFKRLITRSIAREEIRDEPNIRLSDILVDNGYAPTLKGIDLAISRSG